MALPLTGQQQQHHEDGGGGGGGDGGGGGGWRPFFEHPLTAATTAMLNIGGGGGSPPDDHAQANAAAAANASMGFVYECYKLPPPPQQHHHHMAALSDKDKLDQLWPTTSASSSPTPPSSGPLLKPANGAGLELVAPPSGGVSAAELQGLFLQQQSPHLEQAVHLQQQVAVKREPEDLSHHRHKGHPGSPKQLLRHKLVLVGNGGAGGELEVKEEGDGEEAEGEVIVGVVGGVDSRALPSPQHGSREAVTGTPSSTSSLLAGEHAAALGPDLIGSDLKPGAMYAFSAAPHGAAAASPAASPIPYSEHGVQYAYSSMGGGLRPASASAAPFDAYYNDYFAERSSYQPVRQQQPQQQQPQQPQQQLGYADAAAGGEGSAAAAAAAAASAAFVERYVRQSSAFSKGVVSAAAGGLSVDLPSPDSGIGTESGTPRDQAQLHQQFDYAELCQAGGLMGSAPATPGAVASAPAPATPGGGRSRPWHDFGRQNDDKIQIPKLYLQYGFKYHLESPISTSQRREDDRITYINKGQFYGISLEYVPDPDKPLKSNTVKSVVMLMFREEKSPEDEIKAWQFWHGRQHSVKQRILDADTKNSVGLVGCIEEVAHNAIAVYWNPLESSAKISVAVQCLSTDFSSQKGVKGLPLHLQIDTYEDPRDTTVTHRGYCQIKVFCDKGAERKTRDEERRAAKRKMTATGRKKLDELYHPAAERSEFYAMSDLSKPPVLFSPAEDIDKLASMELGFYGHDPDASSLSNGEAGGAAPGQQQLAKHASPFLLHSSKPSTAAPTLKFHNHFPPDAPGEKKDPSLTDAGLGATDSSVFACPPQKRHKLLSGNVGPPPLSERVMLYVRQETEDVYTPLHVVPPTTQGLLNAIENKYKISTSSISNLYRKNKKGITAKIDSDMLKYYCNEDLFLMEIKQGDTDDTYDITLVELMDH